MTCIGGLLDKMTGSVILTAEEVKEVEDHIDQLEAENAKLREEAESWRRLTYGLELPEYPFNRLRWEELERENGKLRELVRDMWCEGMCECGSRGKCAECMYDYPTRMRELGIEVGE